MENLYLFLTNHFGEKKLIELAMLKGHQRMEKMNEDDEHPLELGGSPIFWGANPREK